MPLFRPPAREERPDRFAERLARLRERLGLAAVMKPLAEQPAELTEAVAALRALREGGFPWYAGLEGELGRLRGRAHEQLHQAEGRRAALVAPVCGKLDALEAKAAGVDAAARAALERELDPLDDALVACERQLEATLTLWAAEVERALDRVRQGEEALAGFASAGFALPAEERPLIALGASWLDDPEKPPGQLLLTDRRLRFERRDDRVLRRNRMGLAVESARDRALLLDEPYTALARARESSAGLGARSPRVALDWEGGRTTIIGLERASAAELCGWLEALRRGDLSRFR